MGVARIWRILVLVSRVDLLRRRLRPLQQRLTKAINDELIAHEGFGGVDNVYFRSLIIQ